MSRKIMMIIVGLLVVGLILPLALSPNRGSSPEGGIEEAEAWLAIVDSKQYRESWTESATLFQKAVPSQTWERQMSAVRTPLGTVISRTLIGSKRVTELPGAPDGDYVVIQYRTKFEGKKDATETVTPMMDGDRGWRVSGYYIN